MLQTDVFPRTAELNLHARLILVPSGDLDVWDVVVRKKHVKLAVVFRNHLAASGDFCVPPQGEGGHARQHVADG